MRRRQSPHQDFSDIDHLERATESFMRAQRKALGAPGADIAAIVHILKRGTVFVVLGAIFLTALIGGIRFGTRNDAALRQPETSETTTTTSTRPADTTQTPADVTENASTPPQTTKASSQSSATSIVDSTDITETMATDALTSSMTEGATFSTSTTLFTTAATPMQPVPTLPTTVVHTTPPPSSTTVRTTTTLRTTSRTPTTTSRTTTRTTTSRTTTTTTRATTTSRTTTTRTTTSRTTTTTRATTTTTAPSAAVRCAALRVLSSTWNGTAYEQTIVIEMYNGGTADSSMFSFEIRCMMNGGKFSKVTSNNTSICSVVSYGSPNISLRLNRSISPYTYCSVTLTVQSSSPITSVSYLG